MAVVGTQRVIEWFLENDRWDRLERLAARRAWSKVGKEQKRAARWFLSYLTRLPEVDLGRDMARYNLLKLVGAGVITLKQREFLLSMQSIQAAVPLARRGSLNAQLVQKLALERRAARVLKDGMDLEGTSW